MRFIHTVQQVKVVDQHALDRLFNLPAADTSQTPSTKGIEPHTPTVLSVYLRNTPKNNVGGRGGGIRRDQQNHGPPLSGILRGKWVNQHRNAVWQYRTSQKALPQSGRENVIRNRSFAKRRGFYGVNC